MIVENPQQREMPPPHTPQQQYCLRWNNHRSNLLNVFEELFRTESFTDVTLACEGGNMKCHRVVLAACSSYFQFLFSDLQCNHPLVVLKDVRYTEMWAILEYMYRGEVSIAQDQLAPLLKVAEDLKVKGLVEDNGYKRKNPNENEVREKNGSPTLGVSTTFDSSGDNNSIMVSGSERSHQDGNGHTPQRSASPNAPVHSSSYHRPNYYYGKAQVERSHRMPIWSMATPATTSNAGGVYYAADMSSGGPDTSPLRRKKLPGSVLMNSSRDTPILRTVLGGQGQGQGMQPISLSCHNDQSDMMTSNGEISPQDHSFPKMKQESMSEGGRSPYSSFPDDELHHERMNKVHSASSSPQSHYSESRGIVQSGIAGYVPPQKPEWKRYKQYTRHDIMSAIEEVKSGKMSALQASKKFNVPSRTLYDKVKKLGINTSRPSRRSNGNSGSEGGAFPFGLSGAGRLVYGGGNISGEEGHPGGGMLEQSFLQHALEMGGKISVENMERNSIVTTAMAHHGFLQQALEDRIKVEAMSSSGQVAGDDHIRRSLSPDMISERRLSSPARIQYAGSAPPLSPTSPPSNRMEIMEEDEGYEDHHPEDLSMTRKAEPPQATSSRVIVSPKNQVAPNGIHPSCSE